MGKSFDNYENILVNIINVMHDETEHLENFKNDDQNTFDLKGRLLNGSSLENVGLNEHG